MADQKRQRFIELVNQLGKQALIVQDLTKDCSQYQKCFIFQLETKRILKVLNDEVCDEYITKLKQYFYKIYLNNILIDQNRYYQLLQFNEKLKKDQKPNLMLGADQQIKKCNKDVQAKVKEYYDAIINQRIVGESQSLSTPLEGFGKIILFYLGTILSILLWPFLYCVCRFFYRKNFQLLFKLLVKSSFPLFYASAQTSKIRIIQQNIQTDCKQLENQNLEAKQEKIIFSDQVIFEDSKQQLNTYTVCSFNLKGFSTYLLVFIYCSLCFSSLFLNIFGYSYINQNPNSLYSELFRINIIILIYILLNTGTYLLITRQGNYLKLISEKEELLDLMNKRDIIPNSLYLNFILDPIDKNLVRSFKYYEEAFYSGRVCYDFQNKKNENIKELKDDIQEDFYSSDDKEVVLSKKWISGVGIFTQYLFQPRKSVADELPHVCKADLPFYTNNNIYPTWTAVRKNILKFYNNFFYPTVFVITMGLLTNYSYLQYNSSMDQYQLLIIVTLWINLILYILTQLNNRSLKKFFQSRYYALQRLGFMISLDSNLSFKTINKELPTMDIFCSKSLQTWYDLRVITMSYKIESSHGWINQLVVELFLLIIEAVSQFINSDGSFEDQLVHMNPYLRYLLILALFQRVTTFLLPSLLQQARINEEFIIHKQQLLQNQKKIKQIRHNLSQNQENGFEALNQVGKSSNLFGNKAEIFSYQAQKALRRAAWYSSAVVKDENKKSFNKTVDVNRFKNSQIAYLDELIKSYEDILQNMEKDIKIHKIFIFDIKPVTFQFLGFIITSLVSSISLKIVNILNINAVKSCHLESQ
ncbi:transmembrane protein, putative (macronuclear) [Tetrahymena thermophila SB210]|uniref:Transmembrane protein, putative n=1 Tax=Tetrahymena thermophila (strain SB210) TaxID=312017 RepID=Q22HH5_TETTS|nr:transmembrane protein, putative [Tetrahymena thermophila SB210]EAR84726.2 transmembrane protein, putative [Tetrahymena thermophila SB210]|eukprot:XP_001032389.2 transmembrane protein, putative [Tetrahymena thermophila SB210]